MSSVRTKVYLKMDWCKSQEITLNLDAGTFAPFDVESPDVPLLSAIFLSNKFSVWLRSRSFPFQVDPKVD